MSSIETLIEQVRAILIQTEDAKAKHEIYSQFINECKAANLTESEFYVKVLKPAHKSVNWNFIEEEKKKKEDERIAKEKREAEVEKELEEVKKSIQYAPQFIDRLIKTAFDDDVVDRKELTNIFDKATRLNQDTYPIAEKISALFSEKNYKAYPKADFTLPSLRQTLCSTDWHSASRYLELITPPIKPFPWKIIASAATFIVITVAVLSYQFYLKPKWEEDAKPRYFTIADNATLRSSQIAGVEYNYIATLPYGAELITYEYGLEWSRVKVKEQEGYVGSKYIVNKSDFYLINSIFSNNDSKQAVGNSLCRRALINYFKKNNLIGKMDSNMQKEAFGALQTGKEVWQVFAKAKDKLPNTVATDLKIINPNSGKKDFAVVIKNIATGKRKFLLFTFTETDSPYLVNEQPAPDYGDIKSIKQNFVNGKFTYEVKWSS